MVSFRAPKLAAATPQAHWGLHVFPVKDITRWEHRAHLRCIDTMTGKTAVKIGRKHIAISRPDKVLYPVGKFTKANVVDYYVKIAPTILPHVHNRPINF